MKKKIWIFDVLVIIVLSFVTNYIVTAIAKYDIGILIGQVINLFAFIAILVFAIYRLTHFKKIKLKYLLTQFKNKFGLKEFFLTLLIFVSGKLTYSGLIGFEFIRNIDIVLFKSFSVGASVVHNNEIFIITITIILVLLGVFIEELFFRTYIFEVQYKLYSRYAWIINGISWALIHIFARANVIALLPSAFMLAYVYQRKRNFWIVFGSHLLWNLTSAYGILSSYYH